MKLKHLFLLGIVLSVGIALAQSIPPPAAPDGGTGGRFVEQRLVPNALGVSLSSKFSF